MHAKFVESQGALEKTTQELERLRCDFNDFDSWVKEKIERMQYEDWEEKGRLTEGYLLILRCMFQQYKTQDGSGVVGPSGTT